MAKVLVVDDKRENRVLLDYMLQGKGYQVALAESGEQALELFPQYVPDVVLMDVMMPGMDGHEATSRLKSLAGNDYVPIIFVTALSSDAAQAQALDAGGDDFISKPFNHEVLEAKIQAHLRIRELHTALAETNERLLHHNRKLAREQEIVTHFFDNALRQSCLDERLMRHHVSSLSAFNGDVLLAERGSGGQYYVVLGDFTGHGLSAAMGTLPLAQVFFPMARDSRPLIDIAYEINRQIQVMLPDDMFLAAILVEVDLRRNLATIWSGGMPDGYLLSVDNAIRPLRSQHMPLGVLDAAEFERAVELVPFQPGDRIYFCTDGVTESVNEQGQEFGEENLLALLRETREQVLPTVVSELLAFRGSQRQQDDISLIELLGPDGSEQSLEAAPADESAPLMNMPMKLELVIEGDNLKHPDPIASLADMLSRQPGLASHKDTLYIIFSEIFNNALEHGLLELPSANKTNDESFLAYYQLRARRLADLAQGSVSIRLEVDYPDAHPRVTAWVTDTGKGFDYAKLELPANALYGRGISLLKELCEEVSYSDQGRTAQVVYRAA